MISFRVYIFCVAVLSTVALYYIRRRYLEGKAIKKIMNAAFSKHAWSRKLMSLPDRRPKKRKVTTWTSSKRH